MRIPLVLVVLLVLAAFGGGYVLKHGPSIGMPAGDNPALAQTQPSPTPVPSPRPSRERDPGQRDQRDRGIVTGTVESVSGRTLVVKVSTSRGLKADQGTTLSIQVDAEVSVLREIALSDLRKGQAVSMRGNVVDGKFVPRQILIELR